MKWGQSEGLTNTIVHHDTVFKEGRESDSWWSKQSHHKWDPPEVTYSDLTLLRGAVTTTSCIWHRLTGRQSNDTLSGWSYVRKTPVTGHILTFSGSLMLWLPCLMLQGLHISALWLHTAGPLSVWTLANVSVNEIWPDSLLSVGNSKISKSMTEASMLKHAAVKRTVPFDKVWDPHISSYYVAIWDLSRHSYQSHSGFIQLYLLI